MKIEILGTGCYNCIKLETLIDEVLMELGMRDVEVARVTDENYIRKYMPLDEIPGLIINGVLASMHDLPDAETLKEWLRNAEAAAA